MNAPLRKPWTREEFFDWADGQDGFWEFDGFAPVDMNGGTVGHYLVIQNLTSALGGHLKGTPCRVVGPGAGVATIGQAVRYPDALVTCGKLDEKARIVHGVVVLFEVLSSSTSRADRIDKMREYAAIPSVHRYVIVESTSAGLTVLERDQTGEAWRATTLVADDVLHMPEIGVSVPVAEFYEGIEFV